jgi:hypothetical protein
MEQQLQLKPFERKDGFKYKIIQITDITLHSSDKQPTKSIAKKIQQSFAQKKPGRIYGRCIQKLGNEPNSIEAILDFTKKDPEFIKMIQEEEKNGYKILIELPKAGIPIMAGKDTEEFINSKNGQRILRRINQQAEV